MKTSPKHQDRIVFYLGQHQTQIPLRCMLSCPGEKDCPRLLRQLFKALEFHRRDGVARAVGTTRQRINDWIRGRGHPSLEDGLALLGVFAVSSGARGPLSSTCWFSKLEPLLCSVTPKGEAVLATEDWFGRQSAEIFITGSLDENRSRRCV
jgi:Helix-turn-helix